MSKIIFMKCLPPVKISAQNIPKIKNAQNLSKSDTSNISSMSIPILMPKIISK